MFNRIFKELKKKEQENKVKGNVFTANAYNDAIKIIQDNLRQHNYIELGKSYDSKKYIVITENETDGSQSFTVRRRK